MRHPPASKVRELAPPNRERTWRRENAGANTGSDLSANAAKALYRNTGNHQRGWLHSPDGGLVSVRGWPPVRRNFFQEPQGSQCGGATEGFADGGRAKSGVGTRRDRRRTRRFALWQPVARNQSAHPYTVSQRRGHDRPANRASVCLVRRCHPATYAGIVVHVGYGRAGRPGFWRRLGGTPGYLLPLD